MKRRNATGLAVWLLLAAAVAGAQTAKGPLRSGEGTELLGLTVPMRDKVQLAADVFLPRASGRWPAVLFRTPYNRKGAIQPLVSRFHQARVCGGD